MAQGIKMKSFVAIDFETANQYRSSVCSVGVVVVKDNKIIDKFYSLIHPAPNYYSYWNTQVHGLTIDSTQSAHNSPFDESCLKAVFHAYGMPYPNYTFYCTCRASRTILGNKLPNHQLQTVAQYCGYDLENHHHALADAEACAQIAIKILNFNL